MTGENDITLIIIIIIIIIIIVVVVVVVVVVEIKRTWDVKTNAIPLIIEVTGTISKSLRQYLSNIPGTHEVKELQKTSHIAHILRKVLT
jgi:carbon starvation protein CstA